LKPGRRKKALRFEKTKQNFLLIGASRCIRIKPKKQKFFGSFFQKRTLPSLAWQQLHCGRDG
jgi:hypothetical protein